MHVFSACAVDSRSLFPASPSSSLQSRAVASLLHGRSVLLLSTATTILNKEQEEEEEEEEEEEPAAVTMPVRESAAIVAVYK